MFWKKSLKSRRIKKVLTELSEHVLIKGLNDDFRILTHKKSKHFSATDLHELKTFFHNPPIASPLYNFQDHGLGGWLSACQFAIFEIYYNIGTDAIPFIREIAWGEYDWTQGNAIELLIRFAADGNNREEIIEDIKSNFPKIRYEATLYSIQPLIPQLEKDKELQSIFNELMDIESFRESYEELTEQ